MRHDGVKSTGGHILEAQVLLDRFMKQFNRPAEPIADDDLACRYSHIIAGSILAATIRSFPWFGAHQRDLTYVAQISNRVSDAKCHSLMLGTIRHDPDGFPLEPTVMAKERGNVTPLLGLGRGQVERLRLHTAGFTQGHNALPMLVGNGSLALFIVVAAVR